MQFTAQLDVDVVALEDEDAHDAGATEPTEPTEPTIATLPQVPGMDLAGAMSIDTSAP